MGVLSADLWVGEEVELTQEEGVLALHEEQNLTHHIMKKVAIM